MAKANKIEIRLTDAEKAACQEQATAEGLDLSKWARQRLLSKPLIEVLTAEPEDESPKFSIRQTRVKHVVEEILPDHPPKQKRDKDGLLPVCERCQRLGNFGMDRNYNCPTCGRNA